MGIQVKKGNPKAARLNYGVSAMLTRLLPSFKTPTYGDMQRIDGVMKILSEDQQQSQKGIQAIFAKHNIPDDEVISSTHPLYHEINNEISNSPGQFTQDKIAAFSLEELNNAIDGLNFNYSERKLLEFWLVKK